MACFGCKLEIKRLTNYNYGETEVKVCPLCSENIDLNSDKCQNCGFNFNDQCINEIDYDLTRTYISNIPKLNWCEKVIKKQKIYQLQISKFGYSSTSPHSNGWSKNKTAKLLKECHTETKRDLKLAEAIQKYPELKDCIRKEHAVKRLKQIENEDEIHYFRNEKDLHKYLISNWNNLPLANEWEIYSSCKDGKYNTSIVGEMDILAKHRIEERWLVIELKIEHSSDETVGQLLRYMGWVKENLAKDKKYVRGLIISDTIDENIKYALKLTDFIELRSFEFKNDEFKFVVPRTKAYKRIKNEIAKWSSEELEKFEEMLTNRKEKNHEI